MIFIYFFYTPLQHEPHSFTQSATPLPNIFSKKLLLNPTQNCIIKFPYILVITIKITDQECLSDLDCPSEKSCIGIQCIDPCSLRGACGENALCTTVLHRPRCSCPNCHTGRPDQHCKPEPKCEEMDESTRPRVPDNVLQCQTHNDCPESLACSRKGQCEDPCFSPDMQCDEFKKCIVRNHRPVCVCKFGFVVNENGELTCAMDKKECRLDDDCESNMACSLGKCKNPCVDTPQGLSPCPQNKTCTVENHRALCICLDDCVPTISICLRDRGCPEGLACRDYQCVNPCIAATCAEDSPCYVEDHKPICKFCPPGFLKDSKNGCLKGKTIDQSD